jgi:hypothetical protein
VNNPNLDNDLRRRQEILDMDMRTYAPKELTFKALADKYKVNWVTVKRRNSELGFKRRPVNFQGLEHDLQLQLLSSLEIAERYGVDVKTVYNRKKKLGLVKGRKNG